MLHSLRDLAAELGRSKRTLQLWAKELPEDCKQRTGSGAILITDAGAELLRQKGAKTAAQEHREISHPISQETAKNEPDFALNRENLAENCEIDRETAKNSREKFAPDFAGAQENREISHPISHPDADRAALLLALDALQRTIDRQAAELDSLKEAAAADRSRAESAEKSAAVYAEQVNSLQQQLAAAKAAAEQQAAELIEQRQTVGNLTAQLTEIANKQADAIRAGAAQQLALAANPETEPETQQQRRGFLARLFHKKTE
ncbi:MAG: hypothetical protein J6S41_04740 [Clostridia bacterium]|nr:hypothetical protein [Clostridia bacterium]